MPRPVVIRTSTAVLATCTLAISAVSIAPASATSSHAKPATLPSQAYRAHDYAHGQAMSILPPGENGLVTSAQLVAYGANSNNRPPHSQDQLAPYENLLY